MTDLHLPITYIGQIESFLSRQGVDSKLWLAVEGLSPGDLNDPQRMLNYKHYAALITAAARLDGRDDVGLRIGQHLKIHNHGALGFALMNCTDMTQVTDLITRYIRTRTPLLEVKQCRTSEQSLVLSERFTIDEIRVWFMEAVVVSLCNVFCFLDDAPWLIKEIQFPFDKPHYWQRYAEFIPFPVSFAHSELKFVFSDKAESIKLDGDPLVLKQATEMCESQARQFEREKVMSETVTHMLEQDCGLGLEEVASNLNLTKRTLHRKLVSEDSSFHQIQEQVRAKNAQQLLLEKHRSIKEVAYLLGYSDVANFRRAFKRWHGASPKEFRQSHFPAESQGD